MTKETLKLVRSPERQALADAIERHAEVSAPFYELQVGIGTALFHIEEQRVVVSQAERDVEFAKSEETENVIAVFTGKAAGEPRSIDDLETNLRAARNKLEVLQRAADEMEERRLELSTQTTYARWAVDEAVKIAASVDPAVASILAEMKAVAARYQEVHAAMRFLWSAGALPDGMNTWGQYDDQAELPADAPLRAAFAALRENADVRLPDVSTPHLNVADRKTGDAIHAYNGAA